MATPLLIVGPQRSGTSILAKTICLADGVSRRQHHPSARWDIPAVAELASDLGRTPWLDDLASCVRAAPERFRVAKFALPVWAESLAWTKLDGLLPGARFILIRRGAADTFRSWLTLPYLEGHGSSFLPPPLLGPPAIPAAFELWHMAVTRSLSAFAREHQGRAVLVEYEDLLLRPDALSAVWRLIDTSPPRLPADWWQMPRHWSIGGEP